MAGGTWIDQNKVRPGVYINYKSSPQALSTMGERGTVAIARQLSWGEVGKLIAIEDPSDCATKLGYSSTADEMLFIRQILLGSNRTNGAKKVLVWRLDCAGASKASALLGTETGAAKAEARYVGTRGNDISIVVTAVNNSENTPVGYAIQTLLAGKVVESVTVGLDATGNQIESNSYVVFSGGAIKEGTYPLTGGSDGNPYKNPIKASAELYKGSSIVITAEAVVAGEDGNRISVEIGDTHSGSSQRDLIVYVDNIEKARTPFSGGASNSQVSNEYVVVNKTGNTDWTTVEKTQLSGGSDGTTPDASIYDAFFTALKTTAFDVLIYDGKDATLKSTFASFVKDQSNEEGKRCQCVLSEYVADNECIISCASQSVTLDTGAVLKPEQLTWWVGGASAGANVNESLTYSCYPGAVDIEPKLTRSEQEAQIEGGNFALISQFDKIQVLTDINSFTTFSVEKGKAFRKNRVVRTVFGLCNDIYKTFALYYIGAVHNDEEGRKALKAEILNLMLKYQGNRALQNVVVDDVTVNKGVDSDAVVIEINCQPVDSIEKIYINITIS